MTSAKKVTVDEAALREILAIAERLKRIENCAASAIEEQPCVTRDVRWCGREISRILERVGVR